MRRPFLLLTLTITLVAMTASAASAASTDPRVDTGATVSLLQETPAVDDNDDTRVEVQLVTLGVVAAVVLGAGITGYLVRRRLGLTAYNPDDHQASHH